MRTGDTITFTGRRCALVAASLVMLGAYPLDAQDAPPGTARLVGQVVSAATGEPLVGVSLSFRRTRSGAVTDSAGNFRVPNAAAGPDTLEVRYVGYENGEVALDLVPNETTRLTLLMSPNVVRVAELYVEVERPDLTLTRGFDDRRKKGLGHFFDRSDIEDLNPRYPSDLMRRVPGLRVRPDARGKPRVVLGRSSRQCPPAIIIDGLYLKSARVDDYITADLDAIEIYTSPSTMPGQFQVLAPSACGAIVMWTRRGERSGRG